MEFSFEFYDFKIGAPIVSLAKYGLTFSKGAIVKMGRPQYIKIGFDKNSMLIGIQVCGSEDDKAVEFASKERQGNVRINNKQFVRYIESVLEDEFRVDTKATPFMGKWYEDKKLLVIDLKKPYSDSTEDAEEEGTADLEE